MPSHKSLFAGLAVLLAFLAGFIVGEMQNSSAPAFAQEDALDPEQLQKLIRQELQAFRNEQSASLSTGGSALQAKSNSSAAPQSRTPAWDPLTERLTNTVIRLESAISSMERVSEPTLADQVRLAKGGNHPQNQRAVRDYCRRSAVADDEDREVQVRKELLYLTPAEILEKFGEPNEIELEVGSMSWEYSREWETADEDEYYWYLYLKFTSGAVMDVNAGCYEGN